MQESMDQGSINLPDMKKLRSQALQQHVSTVIASIAAAMKQSPLSTSWRVSIPSGFPYDQAAREDVVAAVNAELGKSNGPHYRIRIAHEDGDGPIRSGYDYFSVR